MTDTRQEPMKPEDHPFHEEFQKLYYDKKGRTLELMTERIFKPTKYPEFHDYLNCIHEHWIWECSHEIMGLK